MQAQYLYNPATGSWEAGVTVGQVSQIASDSIAANSPTTNLSFTNLSTSAQPAGLNGIGTYLLSITAPNGAVMSTCVNVGYLQTLSQYTINASAASGGTASSSANTLTLTLSGVTPGYKFTIASNGDFSVATVTPAAIGDTKIKISKL